MSIPKTWKKGTCKQILWCFTFNSLRFPISNELFTRLKWLKSAAFGWPVVPYKLNVHKNKKVTGVLVTEVNCMLQPSSIFIKCWFRFTLFIVVSSARSITSPYL